MNKRSKINCGISIQWGYPGGMVVKNLPANARDAALIPGGGNGSLLQYSCLGNLMDRGTWWAIVLGVTKVLDMIATKQQQQT